MAKGVIANHLIKMRNRGMMSKPSLVVNARMDTGFPGAESPQMYEKKELKRVRREIKAIKQQLSAWDADAVASKAEKSLRTELAIAKARLAEYSARVGGSEKDDDEPIEE